MTRVSSEGPSFAKYQFSEIYHLKGGGDTYDCIVEGSETSDIYK